MADVMPDTQNDHAVLDQLLQLVLRDRWHAFLETTAAYHPGDEFHDPVHEVEEVCHRLARFFASLAAPHSSWQRSEAVPATLDVCWVKASRLVAIHDLAVLHNDVFLWHQLVDPHGLVLAAADPAQDTFDLVLSEILMMERHGEHLGPP